MVTMVTMEIQYTGPLCHVCSFIFSFISSSSLHPLDLSLPPAFPSTPFLLLSSIILGILVSYPRIITIKKRINLDCLAYCHYHTYFVSVVVWFVDSAWCACFSTCRNYSNILDQVILQKKANKLRLSALLLSTSSNMWSLVHRVVVVYLLCIFVWLLVLVCLSCLT